MSTTESTAPAAPVKGSLVPYLQIDGALRAAEFYTRAFGAEIAFVHPVDEKGRTMHVHLHVNGASIMLSDPFPEQGYPAQAAQGYTLMLMVQGIESWWDRAIAAGATGVMPVADMFWGDRYGQLRDPFGVLWALNQPGR